MFSNYFFNGPSNNLSLLNFTFTTIPKRPNAANSNHFVDSESIFGFFLASSPAGLGLSSSLESLVSSDLPSFQNFAALSLYLCPWFCDKA
jgi:hypothetical protein